jgi:cell division protein ZipA
MDFELRSVLLIVGVVVIAAILLHGLFSIRQTNKPIDISQLNLDEEKDENVIRDGSGFDRHGVGVARVIPGDETLNTASASETQLSLDIEEKSSDIATPSIDFDVALNGDKTDHQVVDKKPAPMFASPIAKGKEDFLAVKVNASNALVEEQKTLNLDIDLDIDLDMPVMGEIDSSIPDTALETEEKNHNATVVSEPMDVLILNVVGEDGCDLDGATLLPELLTLGFKFGDMNIFHRHVDAAGQGAVLFSLANMVHPGHFDLDNMEQFSTKGVSLFMTLPHNNGNMETFNIMLNAAAKIAEEFNGQVLDGNRSTLTKQSTQQYVQRIREVERKLLLVK